MCSCDLPQHQHHPHPGLHSVLPSVRMVLVQHILLILLLFCTSLNGHQYLYYASPGDKTHPAGLWGGFIDFTQDGLAHDLRQSKFLCAAMKGDKYYTKLPLQGVAADPINNQVLLELEVSDTATSALLAPLCTDLDSCTDSLADVYLSAAENTDSLQQAKLGPYALWNGSVYFVARRYSTGDADRSRNMRMEIRKLTGCMHLYPFTARNKIDLDRCSEFVALVLEEYAARVVIEMRENLKPSDTLYVLSTTSLDSPVFLLQIYNYTFTDEVLVEYNMHLMEVAAGERAVLLHTEKLPLKYTWHILGELGGISYRDGVLCWTTIDRMLCAYWSGRGLANTHIVLEAGRANTVCTGTRRHAIYGNITSGVAIADVSKQGLSIYFGCYASKKGKGGAGLIQVNSEWTHSKMFALQDFNGPIYAGSMFLTDRCDSMYTQQHQDFQPQKILPESLQTLDQQGDDPSNVPYDTLPGTSSSTTLAQTTTTLSALILVTKIINYCM